MKQLLAYPIVSDLEYRSKIVTQTLNEMLKSIEESTLRAIIRGSETKTSLDNLNLGVVSSYNSLQRYGTMLSYPTAGSLFASAFSDIIIPDGGHQDMYAGTVTLDWDESRKFSKVPRYDSDDDGIVDSVSPNVIISVDGTVRNPNDGVYNILSRKNNSFWIEQTTAGDHSLEIQFPPSLNKKFNYLEIIPFPIFGMSISGVTYYDIQSRGQTIYPNTENAFYNDSGPLIFHLTPKEFNNTIKIDFQVLPGIDTMGFSNIDVALIDYNNTPQTFYLPFANLPTNVTSITPANISLDYYVEGQTDPNLFFDEISLVNDIENPDTTILNCNHTQVVNPAAIDISNRELYLKIIMKEVGMTTPVFRGCQLTYS